MFINVNSAYISNCYATRFHDQSGELYDSIIPWSFSDVVEDKVLNAKVSEYEAAAVKGGNVLAIREFSHVAKDDVTDDVVPLVILTVTGEELISFTRGDYLLIMIATGTRHIHMVIKPDFKNDDGIICELQDNPDKPISICILIDTNGYPTITASGVRMAIKKIDTKE